MAAHPETRVAQKAVAYDLTARVHGDDEARRAVRVSEAAFAREPIRDPELLAGLFEAIDHFEFTSEDLAGGALRLAIASGLYASNGEARRAIAQGGLSINDARVGAPEDAVPAPIDGRYLVVRMGRKSAADRPAEEPSRPGRRRATAGAGPGGGRSPRTAPRPRSRSSTSVW